jgi:pantoate--beta-alanine ligase
MSLVVCYTIQSLRERLTGAQPVAFVPTMGNLHDGHISLAHKARDIAPTVVASIFVNPLQFGPTDDFASYPRTFERDCEMLDAAGCSVVFAPSVNELYPQQQTFRVKPDPVLGDVLEGAFRPGFFEGVCTVVMKLFQCVQPDFAVFGKKDFQQLMVIRAMVQQFAMPVQIIAAPTGRDEHGLALSSRNGYLSASELIEARQLNVQLRKMVDALRNCGDELRIDAVDAIEQAARLALEERGWLVDYMSVRHAATLAQIAGSTSVIARDCSLVVLGAAKLGKTRLIDNIEL